MRTENHQFRGIRSGLEQFTLPSACEERLFTKTDVPVKIVSHYPDDESF